MNIKSLVICIALFAVTRFYLLFVFQPHSSDVSLYAQYAYEYLLASKQHVSFYRLHTKRIEAEQREAIKNNVTVPDEEQKIIPYPPLAVQMLRIPSLFISTDAAWSRESFMSFDAAYQPVFRRMLFLFDLVNFMVILVFLMKREGALSCGKKTCIALGYVTGVLTMPHILYDRLDMALGTLLLVSTVLILLNKKYIWSFIALAAAVNFKISPVVLVPVFALASILARSPKNARQQPAPDFPWPLFLLRSALATGCILALFAPFIMLFGKESFSALLYQYQRGLHIESCCSAVILTISAFSGLPCAVDFGYGAFLLNSPLSKAFAVVSGFLTMASLAGCYFLLFRWYRGGARLILKIPRKDGGDLHEGPTRQLLVGGQLLCMSALIVFSKNFSPQYLFWIFPVLFVWDFRMKTAVRTFVVFLAACLLTTMIFPYFYFSDIVMQFTSLGKLLLMTRAAVLTGVLVSLILIFFREPAAPATSRRDV